MRLIATARAPVGSELGRDVLVGRADGVPLLRAGAQITERYKQLLLRAGIAAIYVEDDASAGIVVEPVVDDATREVATRAVASAYHCARDAAASGKPLPPEAVASLEDVVRRIMRQIETSGGVALALADLSSADAYTFQHSIDVAATGLLLGQRYFRLYGWVDYRGERHFDKIDERLSTLGLGLLLHDIGKLAVPLAILNKPGKLTAQEWAIMKSHPRAGVDMLDGSQWSPLVKSIVLRHHERWDGSGYPDGKAGTAIHQMARVAAVADVYDAITSERHYAPARPAHVGVRAILEGAGALFDSEVVDAFTKVVAPFPPGTPIDLTDGRSGIVAGVPEGALDRPVVRILSEGGQPLTEPYEVSLLLDSGLRIAGWDGERAPAAPAAAAPAEQAAPPTAPPAARAEATV